MAEDKARDISEELERALADAEGEDYLLRLYVAGTTPRSARAIANIKKICEDELKGRYDLEVVDVYQEPDKVKSEQLVALPTLIKRLPAPLRRVIGDLSDKDRVLVGLNIRSKEE